MARSDQRFLSLPCPVSWAGWRTTTTALQQQGWSLSAEQDMYFRRIRLAISYNDGRLYGISQPVDWEFMHDLYDRRVPEFHIQWMASDFIVQTMDNLMDFAPIDGRPQYTTMERKSIKDFGIFATPMVRTEEIIVEPEDVMALLSRIQEMQAPEQAALRAKQRLRASREGMDVNAPVQRQRFHAQIISIADREAA